MAVTDDLNAAITALTYGAYNNAPIAQIVINQLMGCAAQLSPGPPLNQLQDSTTRLQWCSRNNAPVPGGVLNQLGNVWSQLTNGPQTTNPADLQAITLIEQQILLQEPDWASSLWMNWVSGTTTLITQVRGFYTLNLVISDVPWWTHWPSYQEAATEIIAAIFLLQMAAPKFDQSDSSPGMTVSTDGLTATRTQVTAEFTNASATSLSTTSRIAKVYAEIKIHQLVPGNGGVGIANSLQDVTDVNFGYLGALGSNSIGLYDDGEVVIDDDSFAIGPSFVDRDIIGVALDCLAQTVQFRNVTQNSAWSAAYDISALGPAPYRLGVTVFLIGESGTANFVGPYIGTPLSGFGTWT